MSFKSELAVVGPEPDPVLPGVFYRYPAQFVTQQPGEVKPVQTFLSCFRRGGRVRLSLTFRQKEVRGKRGVQFMFEAYIFLKFPESIICLLNVSPY